MMLRSFYPLLLVLAACTSEPAQGNGVVHASAGEAGSSRHSPGVLDLSTTYRGERRMSGPLPDAVDTDTVKIARARVYFRTSPDNGSVFHLEESGIQPLRIKLQVPGRQAADGSWAGRDEDSQINIAPDGVLTGTAHGAPFEYTLRGKVSGQQLTLQIQMVAVAAEGPIQKGARFVYAYELPRESSRFNRSAAVPTANTRGEKTGDCKNVRWKLKPSYNYASGTIDTVRVPVCEN